MNNKSSIQQAIKIVETMIEGCVNVKEDKKIHKDAKQLAKFVQKDSEILLGKLRQTLQRPVKSYTNGEPQYATEDMSTKSQNIDTSAERVHAIDKSIHDDDDIQEYKKPWIGLSDDEVAIYVNVFNGTRLAREIEAVLKERNNG